MKFGNILAMICRKIRKEGPLMKETIDKILYNNYLKNIKREKRIVSIWQLIIFVIFIGIWELASSFRFIDPLLFSSPSKILSLLYEKILDASMLAHLQYTLFETILGFIIGTVLGIIIASLLWSSERFARICDPYLVVFNAMPKVRSEERRVGKECKWRRA